MTARVSVADLRAYVPLILPRNDLKSVEGPFLSGPPE
jgi:hypothetical protein